MFFGQILTQYGMSVNLKKVNAIKQMGASKCEKELKTFPGMVDYLNCYSSQLTKVAEPLKELLRDNTLWCWESKQQKAFGAIKKN